MMKRFAFFTFLYLFLAISACKEDPPMLPEEVLKQYISYVDKNDFKSAKKISTKKEKEYLDELAVLISSDPEQDSTIYTTTFYSIDCTVQNDTAKCECDLEDKYERYDAVFVLVNENGKWLVDIVEDDVIINDNATEEFIQQLIQTQEGIEQ